MLRKKQIEKLFPEYSYLKKGSSRKIYIDSDKEVVLKIAYNEPGMEQNEEEIRLWEEGDYKYLGEIIDYAPDRSWIKMLYGEDLDYKQFEKEFGFKFCELRRALRAFEKEISNDHLIDSKIKESDIFSDITLMVKKENHPVGDICRPGSWKMIGGKPKLVDYGANWKIIKRWYEVR